MSSPMIIRSIARVSDSCRADKATCPALRKWAQQSCDDGVCSFHEGDSVRLRTRERRKHLQKQKTKAAKRRLKKLSGKQRRFQACINHNISQHVVSKTKSTRSGIAIEDLSGIRNDFRPAEASKTGNRSEAPTRPTGQGKVSAERTRLFTGENFPEWKAPGRSFSPVPAFS